MIVYDKEQKEIVIPNGIGNINLFNNGVEAGYNQGYEQGQADSGANARVLNVTENGVYKSKYSDPIIPDNYTVTGVYADGTEFYSYAELNGKVFNTKIAGSINSRLEFWYKGDGTVSGYVNNVIIGSGDTDKDNSFQVKYFDNNNNGIIRVRVGINFGDIREWDNTVWHHLIISKTEGGVWIDGKHKFYFVYDGTIDGEFFINGIGYDVSGDGGSIRTANGCFGMIKIDDTIIIPTADGFLNTNTGELLEVVQDGSYAFTENPPIYGEGELYKTINVNVPDLNGSYDEGYEQGQADVAANARVLDVTKNGVYKSKYSDPILPTVTGVYADGTEFYNYAELNGKVFNTKIAGSIDSRLEFWYKGDNKKSGDGWNTIIGAGNDNSKSEKFQVLYYMTHNDTLRIELGNSGVQIDNWDDTVWHHFIVSKAEGLLIDGIHKYYFRYGGTVNGEFFINGIGYDVNSDGGGTRNANGYFGMIKIDDTIIIPTADGFLNTNTGELLEVVQDGGYTFRENDPIYGEGELYKTINVNVPDLNGSYDEGYAQGKTDGINEQKSKLESISITENGVYSKEDGYNHIEVNVPDLNGSYDEGYAQGQTDAAANARVLNVTENGVYKSKYSDKTLLTEPTGVYENGDLFFDYAYLKNIQYNTNIYPMSNTKIEIWWKYDGSVEGNEGCIIGCQNWGYINSIFKIGWNFGDNKLLASINDDTIFIPFIEGWNHIVMSYADGLWLNGAKIGNFPSNITDDMDKKEPICINGYYGNNRMNSDYFGMVKINDVVFIPTENGFLNTSTNELLPIHREGEYTYTSVVPKYDEPTGELYKTINVNVLPKVNLQKTGLKLGFSSFAEVPEWADFEGVTDMNHMFSDCGNLQTIPEIDTSNITDMSYMFYNCTNLQTIPLLNTSNVTNMREMFSQCRNLQTMPSLDTSKVTDMYNMFHQCSSLVSLPALNAQSLNMPSYFGVFGYSELPKITDFGGFLNLKYSLTNDNNLKKLPNLTYESCINVLNGLYDFTGNGETPGSNQGQLKVHQNFLDAVGNEISIGTNKGWQITV